MIRLLPCRGYLDQWQRNMGREVSGNISFEKALGTAACLKTLRTVMTRWHKADALHSISLWHERANSWLASIRGMHEGVSA